ncbi:MAG: M23 family metallopeptidase [Candidatus Thiodiazotropha sp. (ex Lucinoma borealis)]|nr:M23 family metallopeptidase [Candidatus Thiodiazotropha sp. (ex Lucinoma borealis)]
MKFIRYIPDSLRHTIIGLCFSLLLPFPAWSVTLEGDLTQGGMVIGRVTPGDEVTVNKQAIRVSHDGVFLLGFGRDDKLDHDLAVSRDGKTIEQKRVSISKREYRIQQVNGLPPSKVTPPKRDWDRIKRETALVKKARRLDDDRHDFLTGFIWPAKGIISGVYGSQRVLNGVPKRPHFGVDVAAPVGTKVVAPADGIVTLAHPDMFYSGGTLIVDHGHQLSSSFLHLHKILVKEGERVKQGEPIAEIGATGRVTGAHLDWRMNLRNARIDPQFLVPPMPDTE